MNTRHSILIVDDDPETRKTLSDVFRGAGYVPIAVAPGKATLDRVPAEKPAVVLIDFKLEDATGLALLAEVLECCPGTECIVITGHADQALTLEVVKAGAFGYLQKPYDVEQLLIMVRRVIDKQAAGRALQRRAAQLALLNDIGRQIAAELELDNLLHRAAHLVQEQFGYHHVGLFTLDRERGELVMRAGAGEFALLFPFGHRLRLGQGIVGWVGSQGETLLANDVGAEPRYVNLYPDMLPTLSELSVPIRAGIEVVGVLDVQSPERYAFDQNDVVVMETLAGQLGVAIHNARLYQAIQDELAERQQVEQTLKTSEKKYRQLIENLHAGVVVHAPDTSIVLHNVRASELLGLSYDEMMGKTAIAPEWRFVREDGTRMPLEEYPVTRVISTQRPLKNLVVGIDRPTTEDRAWVLVNAFPAFTEAGEVQHVIVTFVDITARKQAEEALRRSLEETAHGRQLLLALGQAAQAVQRAHSAEEVYRAVSEEVTRMGHHVAVLSLAADRTHLTISHLTFEPAQLQVAEKLIGHTVRDYCIPLAPGGLFERFVTERETAFCGSLAEFIAEAVPRPLRSQAERLASLLGAERGIVTALTVGGDTLGLLFIAGDDVRETDVAAMVTFANQAAIALENARLYQAAQRQTSEAIAVSLIVQALNGSTSLSSVLQILTREVPRLVHFDRLSLALLGEDQRQFTLFTLDEQGEPPWDSGTALPVETTATASDVLAGRPHLTPDLSTELGFPAERALYRSGIRSRLNLPLMLGQATIGALNLGSCRSNAFSADQLPVLTQIADAVAGAVHSIRLYEETLQRNRELALLNRVIAASASGKDRDIILATVCRELALAFDVSQSTAALLNEEKSEAVVVAGYVADGQPPALGESIPTSGNPAYQHLLRHKTPLVIEGAQADLRRSTIHDLMQRRGTISLLLLPIIVQGEVAGSLGVGAVERRPFGAEEVDLAQRVAEQVSGVLAREKLENERQQLEEQFRQAQKMEALGRLAGGVAHDFNNMLTVVHLSTQLLEQHLQPEDPQRKHVERIRDAGRRASNLTRQLLSFSRQEVIEARVLNLSDVVGEIGKMLRRIISEDIELVTVLPDDVWPVEIAPSQVDQVVVNLVTNARDAMPNGGTLTIETANVVLDEAYLAQHIDTRPGEYVMLAVSDTGVGMGDEVEARIFEPFFTTKERGKGTGLGLATVFGIVKQNGGSIWVYSEVGQGTTFKVYLPRVKGGQTPSPVREVPVPTIRGTETILVAEDKVDVRDLTAQILRANGYEVLIANDGAEALQLSEQHNGSIDLLLTDLVMPHMDGRELAAQLRSQRPQMRVLYMSGYTNRPLVEQIQADPGTAFLPKPFTAEDLTGKVRAALHGEA